MFNFFRVFDSVQEEMPAGNKANKKQKQRRYKKRRQLLERSRRSRDDLINSALENTDVVAGVPKLHLNSSRASITGDAVDTSNFGTPSGRSDGSRRALFINTSTPRRRRSFDKGPPIAPNPSTCLVLSPAISVQDDIDLSLLHTQVSSSTGTKTDMWIDFKYLFVSILNSISSIFTKLYLSISSLTLHKSNKLSDERNDELSSKLDMILDRMTELHLKQDRFYERQETILSRLSALENKVTSRASAPISFNPAPSGPPPPPPPPPPLPSLDNLLFTPAPLVFHKKPQATAAEVKRPSRPSITVDDILNVQLKKTPAVKPVSVVYLLHNPLTEN
jgi:hypothetical protein